MTYIIKRNDTGVYVSVPGSEHSYTPDLRRAWKLSSEEEAKRNCCIENETIVLLERELDQFRR
jgi:hypothetical protein